MGLVSTKTPVLDREADILARMDEAAHLVGGLEHLAISPQCGFASVMIGNEIDEATQWRKLELVGSVADRLWTCYRSSAPADPRPRGSAARDRDAAVTVRTWPDG